MVGDVFLHFLKTVHLKDCSLSNFDWWRKKTVFFILLWPALHVIIVANYPIIKLQSETNLSIMEAEIIALAQNCWKLFPVVDGVSIMGKAIDLPIWDTMI